MISDDLISSLPFSATQSFLSVSSPAVNCLCVKRKRENMTFDHTFDKACGSQEKNLLYFVMWVEFRLLINCQSCQTFFCYHSHLKNFLTNFYLTSHFICFIAHGTT